MDSESNRNILYRINLFKFTIRDTESLHKKQIIKILNLMILEKIKIF